MLQVEAGPVGAPERTLEREAPRRQNRNYLRGPCWTRLARMGVGRRQLLRGKTASRPTDISGGSVSPLAARRVARIVRGPTLG